MNKKNSRLPKLEIIHEDDDIIIVNKPAGMLSIPDRYDHNETHVRGQLESKFEKIFVVHRIDKPTSGVMVFAKNAEAHKLLNDQFENRTAQRIYHAFVSGIFPQEEMDIDIPLDIDPARRGLVMPSFAGKESLTRVKVIEKFRAATLLECRLVTGRQHQIRVHCATVGHPLLVDPDYGGGISFMLSAIKRRYNLAKNTDERPIIERLTLHAHALEFVHPTTQELVSFSVPYPKDLEALQQVLQKYSKFEVDSLW